MALDASTVLGSPQLAGVKVNPRGAGKALGAKYSGVSGGLIGSAIGAARGMKAEQKKVEIAGGGVSPSLTITFGDGGTWQLEVPRPSKKHAQEVVRALGG